MPQVTATGERLDQWKGIADYLDRDVSTAIRWAKESGLPVHRVPGNQRRRPVFAYRHEIDAWMVSSGLVGNVPDGDRQTRLKPAGLLNGSLQENTEEAHRVVLRQETPAQSARHGFRLRLALWTSAALIVAAGIVAVRLQFFPWGFQHGGETLLASESSPIDGSLVAGNGNLYFSVWRGGRIVLLTVPEVGGTIHEIPVPFVQSSPQAISKDGKSLLVLAGIGQEKERRLWWVPLDGKNPRPMGEILCHAAALSPDGRAVAYAYGNAIYLTSDNGVTLHLLHSFSAIPRMLRWSLDGMRIIALVSDSAENSTIWRLFLDRRSTLALGSLAPITRASFRSNSISPVLDKNDDLLIHGNSAALVYYLKNPRWPWLPSPIIQTFATTHGTISDIALDRTARKLYYGRGTTEQDELDLFDQRSGKIRPFMPGISAHDVDYSRDGRWITYVTDPGWPTKALWVARSDGSQAKQVATPGMDNIELPRWSPDGRQLAFMGRQAAKPFRIYVVDMSGGEPREASRSTDNQGAPTWSPDGRTLVYGRVICQEENACALFRIDLASGGVKMVPGSEGLSTARWSPDGRYIAALRTDSHQLLLRNERTGKWRKLANGVNGNDLAWSSDSQAIYASQPDGARPAILQVSLSGDVKEALNLSPWTKLTGRVDTWFAVAPNGSLVFVRLVVGTEIVGVQYEQP